MPLYSLVKQLFGCRPAVLRARTSPEGPAKQCEQRAGHTFMFLLKIQPQYLDKVKDALKNKKEILGLIFKKISFRGGAQNEKISPSLYEPFQKLLSDDDFDKISRKEAKIAQLFHQNLRMASWAKVYHKLKIVLEFVFEEDMEKM